MGVTIISIPTQGPAAPNSSTQARRRVLATYTWAASAGRPCEMVPYFYDTDGVLRASHVLSNSAAKKLACQSVTLTVHAAPAMPVSGLKDGKWGEGVLIAAAKTGIEEELKVVLRQADEKP